MIYGANDFWVRDTWTLGPFTSALVGRATRTVGRGVYGHQERFDRCRH